MVSCSDQVDTVVQWLVPHSKWVVGSIPGPGPFCVEFACSVLVLSRFHQSKNIHVRRIGKF